eukprot:143769-Rhodomonas_salina.4
MASCFRATSSSCSVAGQQSKVHTGTSKTGCTAMQQSGRPGIHIGPVFHPGPPAYPIYHPDTGKTSNLKVPFDQVTFDKEYFPWSNPASQKWLHMDFREDYYLGMMEEGDEGLGEMMEDPSNLPFILKLVRTRVQKVALNAEQMQNRRAQELHDNQVETAAEQFPVPEPQHSPPLLLPLWQFDIVKNGNQLVDKVATEAGMRTGTSTSRSAVLSSMVSRRLSIMTSTLELSSEPHQATHVGTVWSGKGQELVLGGPQVAVWEETYWVRLELEGVRSASSLPSMLMAQSMQQQRCGLRRWRSSRTTSTQPSRPTTKAS